MNGIGEFLLGIKMGRAVSERVYKKVINGEKVTDADLEQDYVFNEKTGQNEKNSEWDNTYLLINVDLVQRVATDNRTVFYKNVLNEKNSRALALIDAGSHEIIHFLQDTYNIYAVKYNPQTRKFGLNKTCKISYDLRFEEIQAHGFDQKVKAQFIKDHSYEDINQ